MVIRVGKNGADFCTVQDAINAVPFCEKAEIVIGEGLFHEKLFCEKKDIVITGAGMDRTIIDFDDYANEVMEDGNKRGTFRTYTAFFGGDRIEVRNMTIRNSAGDGRVVGQALAVYTDAKLCYFENVKMVGCQDTLFCAPLPLAERQVGGFLGPRAFSGRRMTRQYFKSCEIRGDIDFIFGGADAVFDDCNIICNDMHHGKGLEPKTVSVRADGDGAGNADKTGAVVVGQNDVKATVAGAGAAGTGQNDAKATVAGAGAKAAGGERQLDKDQIDVNERPLNGFITAACGQKEGLGFVFRNCTIGGVKGCEPGTVFLGRPWREEARSVFLNCTMDETIAPERFSGWGGITKDEPDTFYGEFGTKIMGGYAGEAVSGAANHGDKSNGLANSGKYADLSKKNPWVKDIDEKLAAELSARADEVVGAVRSGFRSDLTNGILA